MHRIAAHFNAVGIVNQPVEDAISQRGIVDLFVPARNRSCEVRTVERTNDNRGRTLEVGSRY
jgi:uridine kinase